MPLTTWLGMVLASLPLRPIADKERETERGVTMYYRTFGWNDNKCPEF